MRGEADGFDLGWQQKSLAALIAGKSFMTQTKGLQRTWTSILDLRSFTKVLNGISILKAAGSSIRTNPVDRAMVDWMSQYSNWLTTHRLGKEVVSRGNHVTFLSHNSLHLDTIWAKSSCCSARRQRILNSDCQDQRTAFRSGMHTLATLSSFNLKSLITNAKPGDQIGGNSWHAESKYGAAI
ncbi:hypothetical protein DL96DRAFT_1584992 [Flagelloscypha sp. PMI_526]|nr:hypothetical protein DL96DRAFT_1584992 [Flagelloscypha sp. PMI_526]